VLAEDRNQARQARNCVIDREYERQSKMIGFIERQRSARRWIALIDIVDYCAQSTKTNDIHMLNKARKHVYGLLWESVLNGDFDRVVKAGKAKKTLVLWLDPAVITESNEDGRRFTLPRLRLTKEALICISGSFDVDLSIEVLKRCWVPRGLAKLWFDKHRESWPRHFDPTPCAQWDNEAHSTEPTPSAQPLSGRALEDALDKWVLQNWGADLSNLPGREDLLRLARAIPEYRRANQNDVRALRRKYAPPEIKRGGGGLHRER
jgi:hypothetical protein